MIMDKYNHSLDLELNKFKTDDEKLAFMRGVQFQTERSQKMMESLGK